MRIVDIGRSLDENPGVARTLSKQLIRSGTTIGANVEERQASQSPADFISTYAIACTEARETHYWLRLLSEVNLADQDSLGSLRQECHERIAIPALIVKRTRATFQ